MLLINNRVRLRSTGRSKIHSCSILWSNSITSTKYHTVPTESFQIIGTHQPVLWFERPERARAWWLHVSISTSLYGQNRPTETTSHIKFTPANDPTASRHEGLILSTTEPLWSWWKSHQLWDCIWDEIKFNTANDQNISYPLANHLASEVIAARALELIARCHSKNTS